MATLYLPMTSGQHWCMGEMKKVEHPGWYSIECLVKTKLPMDEAAIREAVMHMVHKYESLRVRISLVDDRWIQEVYSAGEAEVFAVHDLSAVRSVAPASPLASSSPLARMKDICIRERQLIEPERGNLARVLFFRFSDGEGRLWFYFHHLVSDFVSMFIFTSEFMTAYDQFAKGVQPKRQVSLDYRRWLYMLDGYCRDAWLPAESAYWTYLPWDKAGILPSDYPEKFTSDDIILGMLGSRDMMPTYRADTQWLDEETTVQLYSRFGAEFENVLIAAFFLTIADHKGMEWLDIHVCNAGRNILPPEYGVNINALIGFLATTRAVLLRRPQGEEVTSVIRSIIRQMEAIPNGGIGWAFLGDRIKARAKRPKAEIFFNYLGRVNTDFSNERYEVVDEDTGAGLYPNEVRNNLLACDVGIRRNRLFVMISYSELYFDRGAMQELLESMTGVFTDLLQEQTVAKIV